MQRPYRRPLKQMITLRQINGKEIIVNAEHISHIEKTPNTVITLLSGNKMVVAETPEEVVQKVIAYKREILSSRKE